MTKNKAIQLISYVATLLTLKLLTFLENHNGKFFFLFGKLMFFRVGDRMEIAKHPDFAPFFAHFNFVKFFGPK